MEIKYINDVHPQFSNHTCGLYQTDIGTGYTIAQGEICAKPFIHHYPSGKTGCFFRIDGNGPEFSFTKENDDFTLVYCVAYNRLGTDIFKRFSLGDNIYVEGVLEVSADRHGKNIYDMTVTSFKRIEE